MQCFTGVARGSLGGGGGIQTPLEIFEVCMHIYTHAHTNAHRHISEGVPPSQNKILAVPLQCFKQMQKYSILALGLCCESTNLVRVSSISSLQKLLPTAEH